MTDASRSHYNGVCYNNDITFMKNFNFRKLAFLGIVFAIYALGILAHPAVARADAIDDVLNMNGDTCAWVSDSNVNCHTNEFWLDPFATVENKKATYQWMQNGQWKGAYLVFTDSSATTYGLSRNRDGSSPVSTATLTDNGSSNIRTFANGGGPPNDGKSLTTTENSGGWTPSEVQADGAFDSNHNGTGYTDFFVCGLKSKPTEKCWVGKKGDFLQPLSTVDSTGIIAGLGQGLADSIGSDAKCDNDAGSLSFVLCPLLNVSKNAISYLIGADGSGKGFIVELLTFTPLSAGDNATYKIWGAFRDIALSLYILIFIVIIFGNAFGADAYTIKRTLPRLAVGALLTAASFFIVQTLVDLSNILGNAIPALISAVSSQAISLSGFKLDFNFAQGSVAIILILILIFAALAALLVGLVGLIARSLIIYALILTAPFAFVAWTLPNTERLFKKWWSELIKVLMMFPIVTGMLAVAMLFQHVATSDSEAPFAVQLAGVAAPLIALMAIPKTFKWGGGLFAAGAGFLAGRASKGVGFAKDQSVGALQRGRENLVARKLGTGIDNADLAKQHTDKGEAMQKAAGQKFKDSQSALRNGDYEGAARLRKEGQDLQAQAGHLGGLASRAERAAKRSRGVGSIMAGNLPSTRGFQKTAARVDTRAAEEQKGWEARARYMSSKEVNDEMTKYEGNSSPLAKARYTALHARALKTGRAEDVYNSRERVANKVNSLQSQAQAARASGDLSKAASLEKRANRTMRSFNEAITPNYGDVREKAIDAGFISVDSTTGQVNQFDIKSVAPDLIALQHKSTLKRLGQTGRTVVNTATGESFNKFLKEGPGGGSYLDEMSDTQRTAMGQDRILQRQAEEQTVWTKVYARSTSTPYVAPSSAASPALPPPGGGTPGAPGYGVPRPPTPGGGGPTPGGSGGGGSSPSGGSPRPTGSTPGGAGWGATPTTPSTPSAPTPSSPATPTSGGPVLSGPVLPAPPTYRSPVPPSAGAPGPVNAPIPQPPVGGWSAAATGFAAGTIVNYRGDNGTVTQHEVRGTTSDGSLILKDVGGNSVRTVSPSSTAARVTNVTNVSNNTSSTTNESSTTNTSSTENNSVTHTMASFDPGALSAIMNSISKLSASVNNIGLSFANGPDSDLNSKGRGAARKLQQSLNDLQSKVSEQGTSQLQVRNIVKKMYQDVREMPNDNGQRDQAVERIREVETHFVHDNEPTGGE